MKLPQSFLVPQPLRRLSSTTACWKREASLEFQPACLPLLDDLPSKAFGSNSVQGWLEMYGGAGLGANAGGVRCANVDGFQIKGIGRTRLAGRSTDKWHKHGAMSLQDAIKEAIFSELFHAASPYGAVRAVGVVDLGVHFATEIGQDKLPGSAPRALFVREQSVRVGHFMRSSFMDAGPELAWQEMDRMREGIPYLLNQIVPRGETVDFDTAVAALVRIYQRLLHQIATLRAKRLVHGSLIPSNFCTDGRLLDFTTSTAVSTLHPVMVSLGGLDSHRQHQQILESLPDLLFYVAKFDPRCKVTRMTYEAAVARSLDLLRAAHSQFLTDEHLHLFGFCTAELDLLSEACKTALMAALLGAIRQGDLEGTCILVAMNTTCPFRQVGTIYFLRSPARWPKRTA